ncbi:hypothetical protein L195_g046473 [Trifolium pratense]|uniref:Uncharacterized protein n=1 Tax=Trifolium pratense TaxID=57577 RepID=A0A2K3MHX1_TRIPR|nr:hypothetical protein L195_g046473 [Trifolium pratense]
MIEKNEKRITPIVEPIADKRPIILSSDSENVDSENSDDESNESESNEANDGEDPNDNSKYYMEEDEEIDPILYYDFDVNVTDSLAYTNHVLVC